MIFPLLFFKIISYTFQISLIFWEYFEFLFFFLIWGEGYVLSKINKLVL